MLSRWLPGSRRCHSRSPPVASEYTAGEGRARGRRPAGASEGTCSSLLALLTSGRWPRAWRWPLLSIWPLGPPPLHAHCLLLGASSGSLWLVLTWSGTEASRATPRGLSALMAGPTELRGPSGAVLVGVATKGGGPGPRAGSSAMVSREETDHRVEKGRLSVGERARVSSVPTALTPACAGPTLPTQPSDSIAAGDPRWEVFHGAGSTRRTGSGPRYLALAAVSS